ncbi:CLUMA_CG009216, isoform A [Clunio marinus]|uniref:CLUMA_CG009216, isoform A n=1 Tax=Clunio marinus TaxID=568069 RepID=A0A1J1I605_9DIPT|nr:CLUMA_CG009216, isoform A [Clunio marinus]
MRTRKRKKVAPEPFALQVVDITSPFFFALRGSITSSICFCAGGSITSSHFALRGSTAKKWLRKTFFAVKYATSARHAHLCEEKQTRVSTSGIRSRIRKSNSHQTQKLQMFQLILYCRHLVTQMLMILLFIRYVAVGNFAENF